MDLWAFIDRSECVLPTLSSSRAVEHEAYQRHSTASPFWRTASANSQREQNIRTPQPATPERKVIGASYSHADILKFDQLYVRQGHC